MTTLIIVPAFNEGQTIARVLSDLKRYHYDDILVVNDGSTDATAAQAKGVKIVNHVVNRGLGAALGTGLQYAQAHQYDFAVTFDSDGQHQAKDLENLLLPLKTGKCDVTIGSRFRGDISKMPADRLILNLLSNVMTFLFYGVASTDSLSGLRAFNKKALNQINIKTDGMEISNEFLKEIKRHGLRLKEIPIDAVYSSDTIKGSKQEKFAAFKIPMKLIAQMFN